MTVASEEAPSKNANQSILRHLDNAFRRTPRSPRAALPETLLRVIRKDTALFLSSLAQWRGTTDNPR